MLSDVDILNSTSSLSSGLEYEKKNQRHILKQLLHSEFDKFPCIGPLFQRRNDSLLDDFGIIL
jgi:hypothetical protein